MRKTLPSLLACVVGCGSENETDTSGDTDTDFSGVRGVGVRVAMLDVAEPARGDARA